MTQINVAQLLKSPIGSVRYYLVNEMVNIADDRCLVQGEIELTRTNRGILARGILHTEIELTCSRCLSPFHCPLSINIEEEYFPTTDIAVVSDAPLPEDEDAFTIDEHNILDLGEALRQYALLAVPMKPLCREDCPGICPPIYSNSNHSSSSGMVTHRPEKSRASANKQKPTKIRKERG
jgi:uncharacterized protein